ncbi:MAG: VOC family protein [Ilumatobacteraceae bacterium]
MPPRLRHSRSGNARSATSRSRPASLPPPADPPGHGTRNYLVSLSGSAYLEIIGPDLGQPETGRDPGPSGSTPLAEPKLVAWCVRPGQPLSVVVERVRAAGYDPGEIVTMSRTRPDGVELV